MVRKEINALAILLFALSSGAAADPLIPEMEPLKPLAGTWSCKGKMLAAGPEQPEHPTVAQLKLKGDLGGRWLTGRYDEAKTPQSKTPVHGAVQFGYDRASKQFVSLWTDSNGGFLTQYSAGWEGDAIVFVGEAHSVSGNKFLMRDVYTRSGKQIDHKYGAQGETGEWKLLATETCTRLK